MNNSIAIKEEITIEAPKEIVWDFTQDFGNRMLWDKSVLDLEVLQLKPNKRVRLRTVGWVITELHYKLCRKYEKTSLKMVNTKSFFIKSGGGSWSYQESGGKTRWTQINTLVLKNRVLVFLVGKIIKMQLARNTRSAMRKAKALIEN